MLFIPSHLASLRAKKKKKRNVYTLNKIIQGLNGVIYRDNNTDKFILSKHNFGRGSRNFFSIGLSSE